MRAVQTVRAARATPSRRPLLLGEALVVVVLVFIYDRIRDFSATRSVLAVANGRDVLRLETGWHLDFEAPLNSWLSHHAAGEMFAGWYYQLMHLTATLGVLVWCYWRHPSVYRRARNGLIAINAVGLAVFWILPVAPPRLLPGTGFVDSAIVSGAATHAATVRPDLFAAMPSLHVAWATWVGMQVVAATRHAVGRSLAITHGVLTSVIVVATANHYVLDVLAGALVAAVAAVAVRVTVWATVRVRRPRVPFAYVPRARRRGTSADRPAAPLRPEGQRPLGRVGSDL